MKLSKFFAMAAVAAGLALPTFNAAEAANVALLPLINNVVEREDLGGIYYDRAVEAVKADASNSIVESTALDKAVETYVKQGELPDKAACEKIAAEGGADIVLMLQIDKLGYKTRGFGQLDTINLYLNGKLVGYNAMTGEFINKNVYSSKQTTSSLLARYDPVGNHFGDAVTREFKRVLGVKKISIERPRIGNLKGNKK